MVSTRKKINQMMAPFTGLSMLFHLAVILIHQRRKVLLSLIIILVVFGIIGSTFFSSIKRTLKNKPDSDYLASSAFDSKPCQAFETKVSEKNIILRFDDVQAYAWREISMQMINKSLEKNISPLLGIIPEKIEEDTQIYQYLKNIGCQVEFAQHGWDHNIQTGGDIPEFGNLNEEEAYQKIIKGKKVIEKIAGEPLLTFIPPNNFYSQGTGQALKKADFQIISSEGDQPFDYSVSTYNSDRKELVPVSEIIKHCQQAVLEKDLCVVMFHPQDYATDDLLDQEKFSYFLELLNELEKLDFSFVTPKDLLKNGKALVKSQYSSWVPCCSQESSLASLEVAKEQLNTILPVWYRLNEEGQIEEVSTQKEEIVDSITNLDISFIPTITNEFDDERVTKLLNDKNLQQSEIEKLINIAQDFGYQGWDLDWEEILESNQEGFSKFVELLSQRLHENNLSLSVTVHAQTGETDQREGVKGQDWSSLSKHADKIRIMAYDFHHSESEAGPITPLDKLEEVLTFAVSIIPKDKIILGLPNYGYDWDENRGEPLVYEDIISLLNKNNGIWSRDEESFALKGEYQILEEKHTLWFEDQESVAKKITIARNFGVYQFCFWSLGGEDQRIWD